MKKVKKYFIITFGCQMNLADSERISSLLESLGVLPASTIEEADYIIFNMCSVRQSAVDRIFGLSNKLNELRQSNKDLLVLLTGCMLESDYPKFRKIFDYIFKKEEMEELFNNIVAENKNQSHDDYLSLEPKRTSTFQALIPISNGCDNFCTYCAVPYTRGRLHSRSHLDILKEVEDSLKKGFKEIWLLGENVNSYQSPIDTSIDFTELIKKIDSFDQDFWLRFTSPHPKDFSDNLISALATSRKVTPYINLPAQSGDDVILKKMNRPYTAKQYLELIKKIREKFSQERTGLDKEISISTDIIVGFPGETNECFRNTIELFKQAKFDMAFISQYSPRPESYCYDNMADDVAKNDKRAREKELTAILIEIGKEKNKIFQDQIIPVLVFEQYKGYYLGRNRHNKSIKIHSTEKDLIGKIINVRIDKVMPLSLEGEHII